MKLGEHKSKQLDKTKRIVDTSPTRTHEIALWITTRRLHKVWVDSSLPPGIFDLFRKFHTIFTPTIAARKFPQACRLHPRPQNQQHFILARSVREAKDCSASHFYRYFKYQNCLFNALNVANSNAQLQPCNCGASRMSAYHG
jgi:hypothetical protein